MSHVTMTTVDDSEVHTADVLRLSCQNCNSNYSHEIKGIQDLPLEILEYIISLLPPYENLKNCMLVCKAWQYVVQDVVARRRAAFTRQIAEINIQWQEYKHPPGPTISSRYTHSACRHADSMYVFGGCASEYATFNDLWRFDLNTRQWIRPLAVGTYPPPKAYATFVPYKNVLILFGGWTHPSRYPIYQSCRLFNQVHFYELLCNNWLEITTHTSPPPMAGHSATVHGDWMIVFGGAKLPIINKRLQNGSNDLWVFDLITHNWWNQETTEPKPDPRFGQMQVHLDSDHILIIGGCGGPNKIISDVWLLSIVRESNRPWIWKKIQVMDTENAATHIWCHPACKVDDKVVFLGKSPQNKKQWSCPVRNMIRLPPQLWAPQAGANPVAVLEHSPDQRRLPNENPTVSCPNGIKHLGVGSGSLSTSSCSSTPHPSSARPASTRAVSPDGSARASKVPKYGGLIQNRDCAGTSPKQEFCDQVPDEMVACPAQSSVDLRTAEGNAASCASANSRTNDDALCLHNSTVPPLGGLRGLRDDSRTGLNPVSHCSTAEPSPGAATSRPPLFFRNTSMPSIRPNSMRNRQRQLEGFQRMEERIRQLMIPNQAIARAHPPTLPDNNRTSPKNLDGASNNSLCMYVLDIGRALLDGKVSWLPVRDQQLLNGPKETTFYSLIQGRGELIMFGGIRKGFNTNQYAINGGRDIVSNRLYMLSGKHTVP